MLNNKFHKITENEFINVDLVVSIRLNEEDEITLDFIDGRSKSYKISNLAIHFYNFLQAKIL